MKTIAKPRMETAFHRTAHALRARNPFGCEKKRAESALALAEWHWKQAEAAKTKPDNAFFNEKELRENRNSMQEAFKRRATETTKHAEKSGAYYARAGDFENACRGYSMHAECAKAVLETDGDSAFGIRANNVATAFVKAAEYAEKAGLLEKAKGLLDNAISIGTEAVNTRKTTLMPLYESFETITLRALDKQIDLLEKTGDNEKALVQRKVITQLAVYTRQHAQNAMQNAVTSGSAEVYGVFAREGGFADEMLQKYAPETT